MGITDTIDRWEREHQDKHPPWGFGALSWAVYNRTYSRPMPDGRMEGWANTVARVVRGSLDIGAKLDQHEVGDALDLMWSLSMLPGGRMLWQLGTDLPHTVGGDSLVNCWYTDLTDTDDMLWALDRMMLGGGVGFRVDRWTDTTMRYDSRTVIDPSGEQTTSGYRYVVPDTREGWTAAYTDVIARTLGYMHGMSVTYDLSLIRPAGAPIRTFGGRAGGPMLLAEALDDARNLINRRYLGGHRTLRPIDILDLMNIGGRMISSGGVRKAAQIALHGPTDAADFIGAKDHRSGATVPAWRHMSNNSLAIETWQDIPDALWGTYQPEAGEAIGLFNPAASQRRRTDDESRDGLTYGVNPCGEIPLTDRESCNLGELVLPRLGLGASLYTAGRILYKIQRAVAALPYADSRSEKAIHEHRRIGIGVTGVGQIALQPKRNMLPTYNALAALYSSLQAYDHQYSAEHDEPSSVRLTTVKPSGTLSLLAGVSPGIHAPYAERYIRRVRFAQHDPLLSTLGEAGLHIEPAIVGNDAVVEFPVEHRLERGTLAADQVTALEQMRLAINMQRYWSDNAVSCTVPYSSSELPLVIDTLSQRWHEVKSMSFLPRQPSEAAFPQMPYERVAAADQPTDRMDTLLSKLPVRIESHQVESSPIDDIECVGAACPVR